MGLDPEATEGDDAYSPSDTRSFTPPPQGLKFTQPILDKVSDITIPPNLQEILANVKRQETSKVDPYLPSKPSASFLTSVNTSRSTKSEKYSSFNKGTTSTRYSGEKSSETQSPVKENKASTLSSMSELDLIKKAAEQLAETLPTTPPVVIPSGLYSIPPPTPAMPPPLPPPPPAATTAPVIPTIPIPTVSTVSIVSPVPNVTTSPISAKNPIVPNASTDSTDTDSVDKTKNYPGKISDSLKTSSLASNQPRPPGLEDDEIPSFLSQPTNPESPSKTALPAKFIPKSGVVLSVKRKLSDTDISPSKTQRTKSSRWGQPPAE